LRSESAISATRTLPYPFRLAFSAICSANSAIGSNAITRAPGAVAAAR